MVFFSVLPLFLPKLYQKGCIFLLFYAIILTKVLPKKGVILYFCSHPNQCSATKGVFTNFALILTKALPKRVFFSISTLTPTKALPQRMFFLYFCPCSNLCLTKNVVFFIFALNKVVTYLLKKGVFLCFVLILSKVLRKRLFFYIDALILTKALLKGCYSVILI